MTLTAQAPPAVEATAARKRRRWLTPIAAATALLLLLAAVAIAGLGGRGQPANPGPLHEPTPASEAAGPLIAMADLLTATPADATTGSYSHAVIEHWSRADDQIIGFLDTSWRGDDGLTHIQQQATPAHAARNFDMAKIGVPGTFHPYPPTASTYSAAEGRSFLEWFGEPPSVNPDRLTRQIDSLNGGPPLTAPCPPTCGRTIEPHVFLDAVIGLYQDIYLDRGMRAAVLRTVAVLPGLTYLGPVNDRAGRPGIGVSLTHQGVRFTLLFDRDTGVLLASERAVPGIVLDDYRLYHLFERRDALPPTAHLPTR